jgi:Uma2 family endonuclease
VRLANLVTGPIAAGLLGSTAMARPLIHLRNPPEVEAAFEAAPPDALAEIIDGALHVQARPGRRHTRSASRLGGELSGPFDRGRGGPGGWVILDEPALHLGPGPDKLVPDLAGWRRERMPDALGDPDDDAHYTLAPDWICEVISPSTERIDRTKKMRIYLREGVRHVWLLSPATQTLEVYTPDDRVAGRWTLLATHDGDERVRAEPFEAFELELGALWEG